MHGYTDIGEDSVPTLRQQERHERKVAEEGLVGWFPSKGRRDAGTVSRSGRQRRCGRSHNCRQFNLRTTSKGAKVRRGTKVRCVRIATYGGGGLLSAAVSKARPFRRGRVP